MSIRAHVALPITLAAGVAIGSMLATTLRAEGTAPAYVVAEVEVHDAAAFAKDYAPNVAGTLQQYGGRIIVGGGKLTAVEGDVPQRFVIIAFDSVDKARGWYNSADYQRLVPVRQKTAKTTLFIAEGVPR